MSNLQNNSKEVFQIAGDAPDPVGVDPSARGVAMGHNFTQAAFGKPIVLAQVGDKPVLLTIDLYTLPGEPKYAHVICPVCLAAGRRQALRIVEGHKAIGFSLEQPPTWPGWNRRDMQRAIAETMGITELDKLPAHWGGRLSIEPFSCTWETEPEPGREYSFSRCPWAVAIDNNVARYVK
jgi:hypothetical protein